jgi:transposase
MNTIGMDVSKEKLDCALKREQDKIKIKAAVNKLLGWQDLLYWTLKNTGLAIAGLHFVMEATGIYHEQLATFLYEAGAKVSFFLISCSQDVRGTELNALSSICRF